MAEPETPEDDDGAREEQSPSPSSSPPPPPRRTDEPAWRWLPLAIATILPLAFFFVLPPLTKSGLWDPYELNVADLARRIALNLHGATQLALEGADNSLPHLNDLGRPQLAFSSIALGFKTFGLQEWAGRAPLAVWGLLGVLATYAFVARLVDRRAGVFSAVALTTMPLYFVQARTMLGDIVTMSAFAMAFGGLLVSVFGRSDDDAPLTQARVGWLAFAVVGLVCGYYSRGGLLGVAVPCVSVGVAWLVVRQNDGARSDSLANAVGTLSLSGGLVVAYFGIAGLGGDRGGDLNPFVGAMLKGPARYPTFDFTIGHLAAALAPWSAFVPFAFGRMALPPVGRAGSVFQRESATRAALLVGAGVALVAHGWMAPRTDFVAFCAPSAVAAGCGVALRDYERGAHPSLAVGVGTLALLGLFRHEFSKLPDKAFHAFAVSATAFPESFKAKGLAIWTVVLLGFALVALLTFLEREAPREPFDPKAYLRVLLVLRDAWDGMLALAYFAMVAGASLAGLAVWFGARYHAKWLPTLSSQMRDVVLNAWWLTAFVPVFAVFGLYFLADVWLWAFGRARRLTRASFTRGFEPFEALAAELKAGRLRETVPQLALGKLVVTQESLEDGVGPLSLFILAPLMYLAVPAGVLVALYSAGTRPVVAAAAAVPSGVLAFLALGFLGDLMRGSRAAFFVAWAALVGGILCLSYYPALANQLSPKEVFESYRKLRHDDEPLALFGVGGRTAAYYAGGQPLILKDTDAAFAWLMGSEPASRRFLVVRSEELARLNKVYRERVKGGNLPVLDARSSQIILVASSVRPDEKNENPLSSIVVSDAPHPQRKLDANLEDKLLVLGYDIVDENGKLVESVAPGRKYHQKTYFKVLAPVQTEWEMFIHIDGFHRRHNGDHKVTQSKYPMSLWTPGDVVVDDHEFTLEPNFTPGSYTNFFGLFLGDTRMKVISGPSDRENRINGGALRVQ